MTDQVSTRRWGRPAGVVAFIEAAVIVVSLVAGATSADAITNGQAAKFKSYRFMVSLRLASAPNHHICGGTLIASDIVLTAAHCVQGNKLVAVVGRNRSAWARAPRVAVVGRQVPTSYKISRSNRDDVALVRLAKRQRTPTISLAKAEPRVNAQVETAGWGSFSSTLLTSRQTVLRDRACGRRVFWAPPMYAKTSICTINAKSSISRGDSGGPLLIRDRKGAFIQVGVTSLGADSPRKRASAYTSVPAERAWLKGAIKRLRGR